MHITTTDINLAMRIGYIGENILEPTLLNRHIRYALRRPQLPNIHYYYAGEPDDRLMHMFGYDYKNYKKDLEQRRKAFKASML